MKKRVIYFLTLALCGVFFVGCSSEELENETLPQNELTEIIKPEDGSETIKGTALKTGIFKDLGMLNVKRSVNGSTKYISFRVFNFSDKDINIEDDLVIMFYSGNANTSITNLDIDNLYSHGGFRLYAMNKNKSKILKAGKSINVSWSFSSFHNNNYLYVALFENGEEITKDNSVNFYTRTW